MRLFGGTVRCPAVSHAIPPEYVAGLYYFMLMSHSCSGIACDFGEGGCIWQGAAEAQLRRNWAGGAKVGCADGTEVPCIRRWEEVWVETDDRTEGFRCDA